MDNEAQSLWEAIRLLIAANMIIDAEALLAEANRIENWNAPWARNRRRKADKIMRRAIALCGDKGLPWGVVWP